MGQPIRADVRARFRRIEERVSSAVAQEAAALVRGPRRPPPPKMKPGDNWRGRGRRVSPGAPDGPAPAVAETTPREDELLTADAAALLGVSPSSFCRIRLDQQIAPVRRVGLWNFYRRADVEALRRRRQPESANPAAGPVDGVDTL